MRKLLSMAAVSVAVLAVAPASALARHHHRSHHRTHHARVHIRHFGTRDVGSSGTPTSGDTAGRVVSFSGGMLTVKLNDGSEVRGRVSDATEMECTAGTSTSSRSDGSGSGGDQGDQGDQADSSGDQGDQGDQADPSGDQGDQGDQSGDQGDQGGDGGAQTCDSSALTPGTVVQAAELKVSNDGASWDKLELDS